MHIQPRLLLASALLASSAALIPTLASGETTLPVVTYSPIDAGTCDTAKPSAFRDTIAVLTCTCPAGASSGSVWGTDLYTDDSSICAAALHKGVIGPGGGRVILQIQDGRTSYAGSNRNGVSSGDYGSWSGSFQFVSVTGEGAAALAELEQASKVSATDAGVCDSAASWRGRATAITCTCPAGANNSRSVWGTDTYTDDSYICKAAIHAGVIGSRGGRVTLELRPGLNSYKGSTRSGVVTSNFGAWGGSYRFVK
jgi:hypothetical protein